MCHNAGHKIEPHYHIETSRDVKKLKKFCLLNQEKSVIFFTIEEVFIESTILEKGDVILLASQGHGFEMLEKSEMIEVKQGPYQGDKDKKRFKT